jgi:AraC-like DNA-binding protein
MQEIPIHINFIAIIIILGVILGIYVSYFLIRKSLQYNSPNIYMGFLIFVLSLLMLEGWLNYSGYIFKVLKFTNFSEPLNFVIAPFIYLFMTTQLGDKRGRKDWLHFVPAILWLGYCMFYFSQPEVFKYNDSISVMQFDIPYLEIPMEFTGDPLGIRNYVNLATIIHVVLYTIILAWRLLSKAREKDESIFKTKNSTLVSIRNSFYHFLVIAIILILVKINFESDTGDYLIYLYMVFMIFLTSFQIMNMSSYYLEASSFLEGPVLKYQKSSLADENKKHILAAINHQMQHEKYFLSSTASLSGLAKSINESSHHVSQVINEKLNQSFFELLAAYRIEEAQVILKTELGKKLTIEEVAERVGYNSKSAFNTVFKKITSQTPSTFRDS